MGGAQKRLELTWSENLSSEVERCGEQNRNRQQARNSQKAAVDETETTMDETNCRHFYECNRVKTNRKGAHVRNKMQGGKKNLKIWN